MNFKHIFDLGKKAVSAWLDDFAPSMGAAISYYTVFSLAPLLVIVIAIAGAVFGREAVMGQITGQLTGLIGRDGANLVQGLVASASDTDRGLVAGTISVVVLLVGATTVFAELQSALDRIWHVPEREKPQGLWAVLRARLLSFGLILGLAFMLMVSLVVGAATSAFGGWIGGLMPASELLLHVVNVAVSLAFTSVLFAMIFKLMPSTPVAWRDVGIGAVVTAVLFEAGKVLIGLYIGKSGITESFQAAGSLVVLLAWVYYAAQIFLLGAEFTKVYADEHGSCSAARATAATQATAEAGIPQEAAGHGAALPAVAALPLPGARTPQPDLQTAVVGVQLGVAGAKVLYELAAIAALHLAARVLSHRRKAALHKIKSLRT
ncbi:YihY/virulence factor BrkB family protein [Pulveribacter sp.]|uniref:YihY/virulence factor BrkB family protein n=1 Tax=Pulveribacter sp. TaxID=2678893 RepID=UPI0028A9EEE9|nr:YihY/virulence factor BrkB family protein [Pulveribacter sp.]